MSGLMNTVCMLVCRLRLNCALKLNRKGFTLVEMIIAIVLLGIVSVTGIQLIVPIFTGYSDGKSAGFLYREAKFCVERIDRELRMAIPNTIRLTTTTQADDTLQFAMMKDSAYYNDTNNKRILKVAPATIADVSTGDDISVYNTNSANFYNGAKVYQVTALGADTITMNKNVAPHSPYERFFVIDSPVTYYHDNIAKRVNRRFNYTISSGTYGNSGGQVLASHIDRIEFDYQPGVQHRNAAVFIKITMRDPATGTSLDYSHTVHLRNMP